MPPLFCRAARAIIVLYLFASAAVGSTDYKLLVDLDNNASTGCSVEGMAGVDRVITTTVDTSGASPRVTTLIRQDCVSGSPGTAIMVDNSGWPASSNVTSGVSTIETRIPLAVFGSPLPAAMRIGFAVRNGAQVATILSDADGDSLMFPGSGARRRAVGGTARTFTVDGNPADWAGLPPFVSGDANQSNAFRILNVYVFTTREFAYFRFDFQSQSAAPTARNDSYSTPLHTPLTVPAPGVLGNDTDPNNRPLTAAQLTAPERGVLVLNSDGSLTYTPDGVGVARETFTYQANNGAQPSNVARVEIRVGQENHAPNAGDDSYTVTQGGTLNIAAPGVLVNDSDPDGDPLHVILGTTTSRGTLTLNSDGSFQYVNGGASGADDQFTYFANDGMASSREATVRIHINTPGSAPRIVVPAKDLTVCAGATATFAASAAGFPAPSLQWFVSTDGGTTFVAIPGATTSPYSFTASTADNGNRYRATFTNLLGSVSTTATLTVSTPPVVTSQPTSQAVSVGVTATFTVGASGSPAPSVQWQVSTNGGATFTNIAGANSTTYSFTATAADNGHQYRAVLTNACGTATSVAATLTATCAAITVTNPATSTATAGVPFSQTFTQTGASGTVTFTTASALPSGLTLATSGTLSGTPVQTGAFPIVVTVTDSNGCTGTSATYTLTVGCQVIVVNNPATTTGTLGSPFSQTFTATNAIGTTTFSTASALPTGLNLASNGTLSGTPTQKGTFNIVVTATDVNGCSGTGATYSLVIGCQTITVTNPANATGPVNVPFSEQFSQSGAIGGATFTTASTLPTGLTLSAAGLLSGTPTQGGTFPIVVTVTDGNGCTGSGATYTLTITCPAITVTNPANNLGTPGVAFSEQFTSSGGTGTITFSEAGALPAGFTFNTSTGVLSGTTTQSGIFPISVTATDQNACQGTGATYNLTINCQTITITNPGVNSGTAGTAFSQTFTATGILGTATWSETGALPSGITLNATTGVLSGTPTGAGTFPITVKVTDTNGCFATSSYTLTIACQTITVTNPATTTGTAGVAFSQTFTAAGILGTATWSESGALPAGITLNATTGVLSGTPTQTGSFPITVTATDTNGCQGTGATYTLVIACPAITVTRTGGGTFPAGTFNVAYSGESVTATGSGATPYTFTITAGALPSGLAMSTAGAISGTPTATGTFTFTVTATDQASCTGTFTTSIAIRPSAGSDSYSNLVNNTQEVITGGLTASPATPFTFHATKITANDAPAGATATAGTFATGAGGSITIATDGTFIYTPPLVNLASDTYTYTISSDTGGTGTPTTATATITLNLANRVWYVNPTAGVNGNGQSQSPWNNTASIAGTAVGDIIFVYANGGVTTNSTTKITLLQNQQLIGQGVTLSVNGFTLVTATSRPTLTATLGVAPLDVVTINSGNVITGVILTNANNNLITGAPAGLTVSNATLNPTGTANGINLTGGSGSVALTNVTMSGTSSGDIIKSNTGTHVWTFTNSPITQTAGRALNATNRTGGSMTFDATSTITVSAGTTDGAITLSSNTTTFTFPGIALTTSGSARAFFALNGGTVNASDTTSTLSAGTAAALDFQSTTIGASGLKFRSISSTGGANGIILNTTGATGSFSIVANGGTCTSSATCTGGSITGQTGAGISLASTLSPSIDRIFIQNTGASGITGTNGVTNFTLTNSRIDNSGTAAGGQYVESNVGFNDAGSLTSTAVSGTVTITGNTLTNAHRHGIGIENGNGTISNLLIQNNTFTSSTSAASSLGHAILVNQGGSASTVSHLTTGTISGNTINNFPSGSGIFIAGGAGSATNTTSATLGANGTPIAITGNFVNGGATKMGSNAIIVSFNGINGVSNFNISNNGSIASPLTNFQGHGISAFMGGTVTGTTTIDSNRIVANQSLAAGSKGIAVQVDDGPAGLANSAADYNFVITNNNTSATEGEGIRAIARASLGKMDVTIQNNTVAAPTLANRNGIRVDSGSAAGDVNLCMKMTGNTSAGSGVNQPIGIRKQGTVATTNDFGIHSLAGTSTAAVAAAQVSADNGGLGVDVLSGDNFVACTPTP